MSLTDIFRIVSPFLLHFEGLVRDSSRFFHFLILETYEFLIVDIIAYEDIETLWMEYHGEWYSYSSVNKARIRIYHNLCSYNDIKYQKPETPPHEMKCIEENSLSISNYLVLRIENAGMDEK